MRMRLGIVPSVRVQASREQPMGNSLLTAFGTWFAHRPITTPHSRILS